MEILRTSDDCFEDLDDYNFMPHYVIVGNGLRMHYVDVGPRDGQVVIMMHGEPSWSYLYRHMIKNVSSAGFRVIAPDLIGFGRSDKPAETATYSYERHMGWVQDWFKSLNITNAVLFCQDWGGLLGLRLVAKYPKKFAGVIAANTFLPTGERKPSEAFKKWREFSQTVPEFPVGGIIRGATVKPMSEATEAAYNAPYPEERYKAGARIFPALVPTSPDMAGAQENVEAWGILSKFEKPFLTAFSDQDPITKGAERIFQKRIPGCGGQKHRIVEGGGHFLQEDVPFELSEIIVEFMAQF